MKKGKTYRICRVLRLLSGKRRPYTAALILAGGCGSRMARADGVTKQMLPVGGVPVLLRSVRAFDACPYIDEIVVVARKEEAEAVRLMMRENGVRKFREVVPGGKTRQDSALRGFEAIDRERLGFVAIHDAARCLIRPDVIADVVAAAYANRAAAAAVRVYDTVKRASADGYVEKTIARDRLWLAATPQVFSANLYRAAAYSAQKDGFLATDDMMLCERIGQAVKLVDCGDDNFKLTTPGDVVRAEAVLRMRGERL